MSDARLKSFFDRLQALLGERDALGEDIAEVKREAAGTGYDPAVLMRVLADDRRRAKNPEVFAEREELADLYSEAINGGDIPGRSKRIELAEYMFVTEGKTVREVAKLMDISKSEAGRLRQLVGARPKLSLSQARDSGTEDEAVDAETGEVMAPPVIYTETPVIYTTVPLPAPAAPVIGNEFPDMPPFMDRRVAR